MKQQQQTTYSVRYAIVVGFMLLFSAMIVWNLFKTTVFKPPSGTIRPTRC